MSATIVLATTGALLCVKGHSLYPDVANGSQLILCEQSQCDPSNGDLMVFTSPTSVAHHLIKKVVGGPGDNLNIDEHGFLTINSSYIEGIGGQLIKVPKDRTHFVERYVGILRGFWVVGRRGSIDSFRIGAIPEASVVGVAQPVDYGGGKSCE